MREAERVAEAAKVGPGTTEYAKPFGSDVTMKVDMGRKYETKYNKNPPPGAYNPDGGNSIPYVRGQGAIDSTKPRAYQAYFLSYKKPTTILNDGPDPGAYMKSVTHFGKDKRSMTLGGKYETQYDNNPPVGAYDKERADSITKAAAPSAIIKKATHPYKRPDDSNPDPGAYDPISNLPFG